jgi:glycosyltransferase involved in cell wall biosynthesis
MQARTESSSLSSAVISIVQINSRLSGGGTDDQAVKLTVGLRKLGHQVSVFGPARTGFAEIIQRSGVPLQSSPANKVSFILRAAKFLRSNAATIIHAHHGRDYWPAIIAARLSGRRPAIVLTRHLAKSPSSWASRHFLLSQCAALVAVSEFTARVLRDGAYEPHSPEAERRVRPPLKGDHSKIRVIYGGIDCDVFQPCEAEKQRVTWGLQPQEYAFAVVGGFDFPRGKGQREFLKAAAKIHEQIPQARFLVIGRGNMEQLLREDIQQLGLTKKARLTGQCDNMSRGMNAIDCLVHPQIGTEALGLVVCEAHACGKAVIASDLDGIPEAFAAGNYGRLVLPESIDALAEAMLHQANQPLLSRTEKLQIHDRVRNKFSVETSSRRVSELYTELMTRSE